MKEEMRKERREEVGDYGGGRGSFEGYKLVFPLSVCCVTRPTVVLVGHK